MKKTALLFIVIALSALFSACAAELPEGATEDGLLAANDIVDFYFYYPENYKLGENGSMISVFIEDNENLMTDVVSGGETYIVNVNPNLSVTVFGLRGGEYTGVSDYWDKACLPLYLSTFSAFEVTAESELEIAGSAAKRYDYDASIAGMDFKYTQVILMRRGAVYTITYTSTPEKYEKYTDLLDTAVRTLNFK